MALQRESERIEVSPDLRRRLNAGMDRGGSSFRSRVLAASVAAVLVAVGIAVWLIAGRGPVKESLIAPPGQGSYFAGYWPVSTRAEAEAMQRRVDDGEEVWRRDPVAVAAAYGKSLGWTVAPEPERFTGLGGGGTIVTIAPMVGEGSVKQRGSDHRVTFATLEGAQQPVWFVAGITSDNIGVDEPRPGATVKSPVQVSGTSLIFEGNLRITVVDDGLAAQNVQQGTSQSNDELITTGGGSEPGPFHGELNFKTPDSKAGIVRFEGGNGLGSTSWDVTVVRVRIGEGTATNNMIVDAQVPPEAEDAFHCIVAARHRRDIDMARPCMTDAYNASIIDPVQFIGPSSPSVERATIVSSARRQGTIVYDAFVYWGSSQGIEFVSEDTITVVEEGETWLVNRWREGSRTPIVDTMTVGLTFTAPGDTPKCTNGEPTPDSFVVIQRVVPKEAVVDDLALSVTRELLTGPWPHEGDAGGAFPAGSRVESVRVANGMATVTVNADAIARTGDCDFAAAAIRQTLTALPGIDSVVMNKAELQAPATPDL